MFEALGRATTALAGEQVGLIERAVQHLTTHDGADLTDVAIQHAKAVGTWRAAVDKPTPERAATAHIAASAAALSVTEQVAELLGPSPKPPLCNTARSRPTCCSADRHCRMSVCWSASVCSDLMICRYSGTLITSRKRFTP